MRSLKRLLLAHPMWTLARVLTVLALLMVGCGDEDTDPDSFDSQSDAVKKSGITVSGRKVLRNNHRFISRGVIFEGFQFPKDAMEACEPPPGESQDKDFCDRHLLAMDYLLNGDALERAKQNWKANTIRFNVNQALLDPSSALHDKKDGNGKKWGAKYLDLLDHAVQTARAKKLVVIIALFSGRLDRADNVYVDGKSLNELNGDTKMATARTKRAMETLVKRFKDDKEVLLEVFNEPYGNDPIYVNGGTKDGETYVGMKQIVNAARAEGLKTPIIVQGNGAYITDYLIDNIGDDNIIYSSHWFLKDGDPDGGHALFNQAFGNAAERVPVIITAWDATPKIVEGKNGKPDQNTWCKKDPRGIKLPKIFLKYVRNRNLGLTGFAFDVPGSVTKDFRTLQDQPTILGATCADGGHAGKLVKSLFENYASRGDDNATEKAVEGPDDDGDTLDDTDDPDDLGLPGGPTYDSDNDVWRAHFGVSTFQKLSPSDPESMRLNPLVFDHKFYLQRYPDLAAAAEQSSMTKRDFAEQHWKEHGIQEGRMGSPTWDPIYYAAAHPDVAAAFGTSYYSMLNHFLNGGRQAGYRASAAFDAAYYYNRYGDLQAAIGWDPAALLDHFVLYGLNEGRQASAELAPAWYLGTSPGLAESLEPANYHGAIIHFFRDGQPAGWPGSHP
ncbi:MAG: cellulase family glycosylhydrolase [Polyangiaceae bacterium]|nr:cellulase family glycosylhydrolase [Polyangiaceae bacterium]